MTNLASEIMELNWTGALLIWLCKTRPPRIVQPKKSVSCYNIFGSPT